MKKISFTAVFLFNLFFSFAAPITVVNNDGALLIASNYSVPGNYSYTDKNINSAVVYYPARQIDADVKFTYQPVKSIRSITGAAPGINTTTVPCETVVQFQHQIIETLPLGMISNHGQVIDEKLIAKPGRQLLLHTNMTSNSIVSLSNGQDINLSR